MKIFKLLIFSLSFILILSSCATSEKKEAVQAPKSFKLSLEKAMQLSKTNKKAATQTLTQILVEHPENNLSDDALFLLAKNYQALGQQQEAALSFKRILSSKYSSPLDGKTVLELYSLYMKQGNRGEALKALNFIEKYEITDRSALPAIHKNRIPLLLATNENIQLLESLSFSIENEKEIRRKKRFLKKALNIMKIRVVGRDNHKVLNNEKLKLFHPQSSLNLAEFYFDKDQNEQALRVLSENDQILQKPFYKNQKYELIQRARAFEAASVDTIGVLLPLSGKYSAVGKDILKGLEFALKLWSKSQNVYQFKLAILDTQAQPEQVKLSFDELVQKDKPVIIIGGIIGRTAEVLIDKAEKAKVPTLILSQKNEIVKGRRYSFQMSQPIGEYTKFLSELMVKGLKIETAAILNSEKSFSTFYADNFEKSFAAAGGEIQKRVAYNSQEKKAIPNAIKDLAGLSNISERKEEYTAALKEWRRKNRNKRGLSQPRIEDLIKPKVDYRLLFIAEGPKEGGLIASTLAYFDVENLILAGPHLWSNSSFVIRGQRFSNGSLFANSYYEPEILESACGKDFALLFQENLNNYSYKGLEAGVLIRSLFNDRKIESRADLLYSLSSASSLSDPCFSRGLLRSQHNFFSPLLALTVEKESILPLNYENYLQKLEQSPDK